MSRNINFIRSVLNSALEGGRIATITFIKKDGTVRDMNCRKGVTSHLKGGISTTANIPHLMTVFDTQKGEYRSINLNTVTQVKGRGMVVEFSNE